MTEHLGIRKAVRALDRDEASVDELLELGALIQQHVRFEEREVFPLIVSRLSDATIATLGEEIAKAESHGR